MFELDAKFNHLTLGIEAGAFLILLIIAIFSSGQTAMFCWIFTLVDGFVLGITVFGGAQVTIENINEQVQPATQTVQEAPQQTQASSTTQASNQSSIRETDNTISNKVPSPGGGVRTPETPPPPVMQPPEGLDDNEPSEPPEEVSEAKKSLEEMTDEDWEAMFAMED